MRLVPRLALLLSLAMGGLLVLVLGLNYRAESRRLKEDQRSRLRVSLASLAPSCAAALAGAGESQCREGLRWIGPLTSPEAFRWALVVDFKLLPALSAGAPTEELPALGSPLQDPTLREAAALEGERRYQSAANRYSLHSVPIWAGGKRQGMLIAAFAEEALERETAVGGARRRFAQGLLWSAGLGLLLSIGITLHVLAPLAKLAEGARRVAAGELRHRVEETGPQELALLAAHFNRMTARLEELDKLKDAFLAQVTHDLKNPLGAMMMEAEVVLEGLRGPVPEPVAAGLRMMLKNAHALRALLDNMLDVARIDSGRLALTPAAMDLRSQMESAVSDLKPQAEGLGVELLWRLPAGLEEAYADAEAFRRILDNLLTNALQFTPSQGTISLEARRGANGVLIFSVRDTGIGIPTHRLGEIFQKFFRVPETLNKVRFARGSGLGLFLVRKIVDAQGGRIWAESELFRGACFYFTLPERAPSPETAPPPQGQGGEAVGA